MNEHEDDIDLREDLWSRSIRFSVKELEVCINLLNQRADHDYDSIALKAIDDVEAHLSDVLKILNTLKDFHASTKELDKLLQSRSF